MYLWRRLSEQLVQGRVADGVRGVSGGGAALLRRGEQDVEVVLGWRY